MDPQNELPHHPACRPARGRGVTCKYCSEVFKSTEESKLQRHEETHHCLNAEYRDQSGTSLHIRLDVF